jgi:hypothetical protein
VGDYLLRGEVIAMSLRRSPVLTPAALRARRLNSLKSTGPRTARGKAWSCLNALRHGQRSDRRTFRDKLVRTGDSEALYLFDFIFEEILKTSDCPNELSWRRLQSLAVRAWCIESGRRGRRAAKTCLRTKLESGVRVYRYAEKLVVPRRLKIANKAGWGFMLVNPVPSRRRRVAAGWIPGVEYIEGRLPKARRVRGGCKPGTEIVRLEAGRAPDAFPGAEPGTGGVPESRGSRWGAIFKAVGRVGSSIFRKLGGSPRPGVGVLAVAAVSPPPFGGPSRRPRPPEDFCEDLEDYESESPEEFLLRHKFLARLALRAADRALRKTHGR